MSKVPKQQSGKSTRSLEQERGKSQLKLGQCFLEKVTQALPKKKDLKWTKRTTCPRSQGWSFFPEDLATIAGLWLDYSLCTPAYIHLQTLRVWGMEQSVD
jgi:hypothetical protein